MTAYQAEIEHSTRTIRVYDRMSDQVSLQEGQVPARDLDCVDKQLRPVEKTLQAVASVAILGR